MTTPSTSIQKQIPGRKKIRYPSRLLRGTQFAAVACLAVMMSPKVEAAVMQYSGPGGRPSSFTSLDIGGTNYDGVFTYNTTFLDIYGSSTSPTPIPPLWGNNALAETLQTSLVTALNVDGNLPHTGNVIIHIPTENKRTNGLLYGVYGYSIRQLEPDPSFGYAGEPYNARPPGDFNGQAGVGGDSTALLTSLTLSTTAPEPSSTALLGLGGLALILRRRR